MSPKLGVRTFEEHLAQCPLHRFPSRSVSPGAPGGPRVQSRHCGAAGRGLGCVGFWAGRWKLKAPARLGGRLDARFSVRHLRPRPVHSPPTPGPGLTASTLQGRRGPGFGKFPFSPSRVGVGRATTLPPGRPGLGRREEKGGSLPAGHWGPPASPGFSGHPLASPVQLLVHKT